MVLPFYFDSTAWPLYLALGVTVLWGLTRSPQHFVRRLAAQIGADTVKSYGSLLRRQPPIDPGSARRAAIFARCLFAVVAASFFVGSLAGFAVEAGWASLPERSTAADNLSAPDSGEDCEIVTEGQTIYARPKSESPPEGG